MALARNLNPKKFDFLSKIKFPKWKKPVWIGILIGAIVIGVFGVIYLTRIIPKEEDKQSIKLETGDRPLPSTISLWVNADGGLVMREGPDKGAKQLLLIPNGTQLAATELSGDWYKITYMDKTGWVNKGYVTTTAPAEDPTKAWNSFSNKGFGYTLRYPKEWVAQDYGANPASNSLNYVGFGPQLGATLDPVLLPPVIVRVTAQTKEQAEDVYKKSANVVTEAATISGLAGSKFTFNASSGTQMTAYVVAKGSQIIIIEETGGYSDELVKIIASLNLM
jgi:hypothetical protein